MSYSVPQSGFISDNNSSTTALGSNGVFTGTNDEIVGYANVSVFLFTDQASATNGLSVDWSMDGTNYDDSDQYTIPASTGKVFTFGVQSRYVRIKYTNGASAQGTFRLQTLYHNIAPKPSSHRLADVVTLQNDAELVLPVQTDANFMHISSVQGDAALQRTSAIQGDASVQRVSSIQSDAALQHISAFTSTATNFPVSSTQGDANLLHTSSFVDSGSISAKSTNAAQLVVSATQMDAGLQRTSAMMFGNTTGGLTVFRNLNLSSTTTVKSTAGAVYGWHAWNEDLKLEYVHLYNTSGAINAGTDVPVITLALRASGVSDQFIPQGLKGFTAGIGVWATSALAATATTPAAASAVGINLFYI